jgi:hypothetical protein
MGADFMLWCVEDPIDYERAKPVIEYRIENLNDEILETIGDELLWYDANEIAENIEHELKEEDLYKLNDLSGIAIRKMVRDRITEAAADILDASVYRRDLAQLNLNGVNYVFTGGMSWGDHPTEAVNPISLLEYSGVTEGMGREDFDYDSFKA